MALEALDRLPQSDSPLLFPAPRGGHIDLHSFRQRYWRPARLAAGIEPVRRPYDLRHTYATFALRAGVSIFDLSRFMGASLAMIDRHYGHLAATGASTPSRFSTRSLLTTARGRTVDVATDTLNPLGESSHALIEPLNFGAVDVSWTSPLRNVACSANAKCIYAGALTKPSDGLEPSTPSLPWNLSGTWSQPAAAVFACFRGFRGRSIWH